MMITSHIDNIINSSYSLPTVLSCVRRGGWSALLYDHALIKIQQLTVLTSVGATDGGDGRSSGHNQLIRVTLVVSGLGLGEDEVVKIKPRLVLGIEDTGLGYFEDNVESRIIS